MVCNLENPDLGNARADTLSSAANEFNSLIDWRWGHVGAQVTLVCTATSVSRVTRGPCTSTEERQAELPMVHRGTDCYSTWRGSNAVLPPATCMDPEGCVSQPSCHQRTMPGIGSLKGERVNLLHSFRGPISGSMAGTPWQEGVMEQIYLVHGK